MPRIAVTPEELEAALAVWLRTLPPAVMERYLKFEKLRAEKRDTAADRVDHRAEMAKHLARKFAEAGWQATYEKKGNLFG